MKKRIVAVTCVLMFCLGLIGCGTERADKTQQLIRGAAPGYNDGLIRVGMIQTGKESDWRDANTNDYLNTFTKERGYDLIYIDGNSSSERQVKAMYDLIQQKVDYIILQPIVENAFKHGISPKEEGGVVRIRINPLRDKGLLYISVCDNGVGIQPEQLAQLKAALAQPGERWEHIGVYNVAARLRLLDKRGRLVIRSHPGRGTAISMYLPLVELLEEDLDDDTLVDRG